MATLLFFRHGESTSNVANTFSGSQDDALLTPKGEEQAQLAGQKLAAEGVAIDRMVVSPMARALRTAELVAKEIGFDTSHFEIDERLREYDMGELTGKPRKDVTSAELIAAPGAEDSQVFMARAAAVIEEMKTFEGTVLIVAHTGLGRVISCYLEGLDPATFYDLPTFPNGEVVKLEV